MTKHRPRPRHATRNCAEHRSATMKVHALHALNTGTQLVDVVTMSLQLYLQSKPVAESREVCRTGSIRTSKFWDKGQGQPPESREASFEVKHGLRMPCHINGDCCYTLCKKLCSKAHNLLHTVMQMEYTGVLQMASMVIDGVCQGTNGALLDTPGLQSLAAAHGDNEEVQHA